MVTVLTNVEGSSIANNYHPVSLLSFVYKIYEKFVKNSLLITSRSVAFFRFPVWCHVLSFNCKIFLSVVSYRIAKAFNKSRATRLIGRYISKAFDRVWQVGLTQVEWNFSFLALVFSSILSFLSNR